MTKNNSGGLVMQVSPFHSKLEGIEVYHNNNECTLGNNIEHKNIKQGTGGKRLCKQCKKLNREGK